MCSESGVCVWIDRKRTNKLTDRPEEEEEEEVKQSETVGERETLGNEKRQNKYKNRKTY